LNWKKKEKEGGYRNGMPGEKETDEVTLGAPKRRKNGGWMAKETAKATQIEIPQL
jgi:hypothetical protein